MTLLIRPDQVLTVRPEPVEGQRLQPGFRQAQPERELSLHRAGSRVTVLAARLNSLLNLTS